MGRYVKKGGHGGGGRGAGRKTLPDIDRYFIVEQFREEWRRECEKAETTRPPKRLRANWDKLSKVPVYQRQMVIELADKDELPPNTPRVVAHGIRTLKKTRTILKERGRVRAGARPHSKRQRLLVRIASEASKAHGVRITAEQLRHWCDDHERLREKLFPRKI